jgi:hypothetical protein
LLIIDGVMYQEISTESHRVLISFQIEDKIWKNFLIKMLDKYGTTKGLRSEFEFAISEYIETQEQEI